MAFPDTCQRKWRYTRRRKFDNERAAAFIEEFESTSWDFLTEGSVHYRAKRFHIHIDEMMDRHFEWETVKARDGDPLYFTPGLHRWHRRLGRLLADPKRKQHYKIERKKFRKALKKSKKSFIGKILDETRYNDARKWHSELQKIMSNDLKRVSPDLPEVSELVGKSDQEKADIMGTFVANITKNHPVLSKIKSHETYSGGEELLPLSEVEVAAALTALKVPKGLHDGDPPRGLLLAAPSLFAKPLTIIYNECMKQGDWPRCWKEERTSFIEKKGKLKNCGSYRPIAITSYFSKCFESIIKHLMLEDIGDKIDTSQFGGVKGVGTDSYFASLLQNIVDIAENEGHSSLLMCFDLEKAFNSMTHEKVLWACKEIGIRPALLRVLSGYLHDRRTVTKWGQAVSREFPALAGCGQGTILSVLLFIITINILLRRLKSKIEELESNQQTTTTVRCFVDDISLLIPIVNSQHHDKLFGENVFEDNDKKIETYLRIILDFCAETGMRLNYEKTTAVNFDWTTKNKLHFFPGCLVFPNGDVIEVDDTVKLLGVPIDHNLTFKTYAKERRRKGMFAMWKLLRLQASGVSQHHMELAFKSYVRSIIEYSLMPCARMLPDARFKEIEGVQRRATKTLLGIQKKFGPDVMPYEDRLEKLKLESLSKRMDDRLGNFALKMESQSWCSTYLNRKMETRAGPRRTTTTRPYLLPKCDTTRKQNGPLYRAVSYLNDLSTTPEARLYNKNK